MSASRTFGSTQAADRRTCGALGAGVGLVVAAIALWPVVGRRGFALSYDMVFVPNPTVNVSSLGLDGSVPRAVPTDVVVALMGWVLPDDVVQHLLLVSIFVLGAAGAARWMTTRAGAVAAALTFVWNPYVLERLVLGHWAFLVGLAVLPWATRSAGDARLGVPGALLRASAWLFVAGLAGATSAVIVLASAVVVTCWPGRAAASGALRRGLVLGVVGLCTCAPWLVPVLARTSGTVSDPAGVDAFLARSDSPLRLLGSLLTLGGVWNQAVWPHERGEWLPALGALLAVVIALAVSGRTLMRTQGGAGAGLVVVAGSGLLLALLGSWSPGARLLRWVVVEVPGGGLLRDGQKFLAPGVLVVALAFGFAVEWLLAEGRRTSLGPGGSALLATALVLLPVLLLPSLARGAAGRLESVEYPAEWSAVQQVLRDAPPGDAASFPWTYYRRFTWNDDRVVLDPVPRLLSRPVVVNDDLPLKGRTIRGESERSRRIGAVVSGSSPLTSALQDEGVRYVVIHRPSDGAETITPRLPGASVLHSGPELLVLDLGPVGGPTARLPVWAGAGWLLLAALGLSLLVLACLTALRPRERSGLVASGTVTPTRGTAGMAKDDSGFAVVLLLVLVAGIFLAGAASFFVVTTVGGATPDPVTAPLVTYDAL